jgi:geranylgeranyl pyrophosphate synthase
VRPTVTSVERVLATRRREVERTLASITAGLPGDDPVSAAMRYALGGGGKRLRPVLCLAAMEAVGAAPDGSAAALRAACAVELVHTYSLVHDDLPAMDNDDVRRGRPTTHRAFGTSAAALAGFALIPHACRILATAAADLGLPSAARRQAVHELCAGAGGAGMVGGQVLDLAAEHRAVSRAELTAIHRMKTGALFRAALRIGGVLGGAGPAAVDALGEFGQRLGLAFQITDDVLDVTSDSAALGKTAGKDRGADKSTFVSHMGVASARDEARAETGRALDALGEAGLRTPVLEALAGFAVARDR